MASQTDLISRLNGVRLTNSGGSERALNQTPGHILAFEFPAVDLLPPNTHVRIGKPFNIERRRQPDANSLHPDLGTEFFTILQPENTRSSASPLDHEGSDRPIQAINSLRDTPGCSRLRVVIFNTKNTSSSDNLIVRFQLQTNTFGPFGETSTKQEFELEEGGWFSLLFNLHSEPWVDLLHHLVSRASERAYFEVRSRLFEAYGAEVVAAEEERREEMWFSIPPRCVEELFFGRLQPVSDQDQDALSAPGGDRWVNVQLPCGHETLVRKMEIMALTAEACLTQQCPTCSARILQRSDDEEISLGEVCRRVEEYSMTNRMWRSLDDEGRISSKAMCSFDSRLILDVLDLSLNSFNAPRSICPTSLTPVILYSPATRAIMQHFGRCCSAEVRISPSDLFDTLYGLAMETETGNGIVARIAMPPGWEQFLLRWIIRAINFLIERRCWGDGGEGHEGLHEHADGWCYRAHSPLNEGAATEAEMRDLLAKMQGTEIVG